MSEYPYPAFCHDIWQISPIFLNFTVILDPKWTSVMYTLHFYFRPTFDQSQRSWTNETSIQVLNDFQALKVHHLLTSYLLTQTACSNDILFANTRLLKFFRHNLRFLLLTLIFGNIRLFVHLLHITIPNAILPTFSYHTIIHFQLLTFLGNTSITELLKPFRSVQIQRIDNILVNLFNFNYWPRVAWLQFEMVAEEWS